MTPTGSTPGSTTGSTGGTDWGLLYREHVAAVTALAQDLDEDQLDSVVAGTPAWRVRDVYAHLAGGPADQVMGRVDGAPGPAWTARHVSERSHLPVADILAELASHQDAIAESTVDNPTPAVVWDIAVHHADLHEALGLGRLPEHLWSPVVDMLAARAAPDLVGVVAPYELFRGLFSRRSRAQMQAWGATLDPAALDAVCVFGPRDDDQPIPVG